MRAVGMSGSGEWERDTTRVNLSGFLHLLGKQRGGC